MNAKFIIKIIYVDVLVYQYIYKCDHPLYHRRRGFPPWISGGKGFALPPRPPILKFMRGFAPQTPHILTSDVPFRANVAKSLYCCSKMSLPEFASHSRHSRHSSHAAGNGVKNRPPRPPSTRAGGQDYGSLTNSLKLPRIFTWVFTAVFTLVFTSVFTLVFARVFIRLSTLVCVYQYSQECLHDRT